MEQNEVVIIGAGLAGLNCARTLHAAGVPSLLLEASDGIGGRVRTDYVEGFLLDRGFQVLLTAYPEARKALDYNQLDLQPFEPGALVRVGNRFCRVSDPWRRPGRAMESLFSDVGTVADKLRVAMLRRDVCKGSDYAAFNASPVSTNAFLQSRGFSPEMMERFFRPFLGGIFLERELRTSSNMFRFVFRMFAKGDTAVPALGMQRIPEQLAASLPSGFIRTGVKVASIAQNKVLLDDGTEIAAHSIVVATEGPAAARLLNQPTVASRGATCLYFSADRAPIDEPILLLNGGGDGPINNLSVPSALAAAVAPAGAALISATVLDHHGLTPAQLETSAREQLFQWFGNQVRKWRLLRTYEIPHAQPELALNRPAPQPRVATGVFVCGDHCRQASIDGALVSGRLTAEALLQTRSAAH